MGICFHALDACVPQYRGCIDHSNQGKAMTEDQKSRIRAAADALQEAMSDVGADLEVELTRLEITKLEDEYRRFQYFVYVTHTSIERV